MARIQVQRILALLPNWLGDAAMCTPALRTLHRRFPEAELTVAGGAQACDLVRGLPWFRAVIPLPPRPNLLRLVRLGRRLRPHGTDLAVIFPHSFRAALLARFTGARRRVGYARDGRSFLLTDRVPPHRQNGQIQPIYMAQEYLDLVRSLGCEDDGAGLELRADPAVVEQVRRRLAGEGPLVGIAPGAAFGPSKRWPAERYAQVADALTAKVGARCVLMTGPAEEETRDAVLGAANAPLIRCDEGRPTIDVLKAVVSQLDLLICNDSGPRHVAVAFGVPVLCVMGPTSPSYSGGPHERGRVLRVEVDCGPCQKGVCETDHRCMTRITPECVVEAALEYVRRDSV